MKSGNARTAQLITLSTLTSSPTDSHRLTLQTKDVNKPKSISFLTTFILIHHSLTSLTSSKDITIWCSPSNSCKIVFQHLLGVVFRRSPNLRYLLVTTKLSASNSANPQLFSGSFRCGKKTVLHVPCFKKLRLRHFCFARLFVNFTKFNCSLSYF